jgi:hypothetical protein
VQEARRHWQARIAGRAQDGWERVKVAWLPSSQAALVAAAAYAICHWLLGHELPLFSPIACYLAMGFTRSRSPRRTLEVGLGATVGIGVGELFAHYAGFGLISLLVVLLVAPMAGRFIDHGELITYQAVMQSVIVVGMAATSASTGSAAMGRWTDALVGTACALAFTVIHPNKPSETPRLRARGALTALSKAALTMARGVRDADDVALQEVWRRTRAARRLLNEGRDSLDQGHQLAFVKWGHRGDHDVLDELERIYALTERAAGSLELAVRYGRGEVAAAGPNAEVAALFARVAGILQTLAASVGSFNKPILARRRAEALARELDPEEREEESWRNLVMVSLLRSTVMDILQMTGLSRAQAWHILPDAAQPPTDGPCPPEDEASAVWGT